MVRLSTLKSIAIYGGVLSLGGAGICYCKIQDNLVSGSYYSKSMQLLGENKEAMAILGQPVKSKYLDLSDKFNKVDGLNCSLKIGVRGSKTKGTLYTWAERTQPGADWEIKKLLLQLKNSQNFLNLYEASSTEERGTTSDS